MYLEKNIVTSPISADNNIAVFRDDFLIGRAIDYQLYGSYSLTEFNNGDVDWASDEVNHPGIINYFSINQNNSQGGISEETTMLKKQIVSGYEFEAQVKIDIITQQIAADYCKWSTGLGDDAFIYSSCTNYVGFMINGGSDANEIFTLTKAGGTSTETATGVLMQDDTWYNFKWVYDGVDVKFYIDAVSGIDRDSLTLENTHTTNIPTATDLGLHAVIQTVASVPSNTYNAYMDYWEIKIPVVR